MTIQYTPRGVCSRAFTIQVEDGAIRSVQIVGGLRRKSEGHLQFAAGGCRWTRPSGGWRASAAAGKAHLLPGSDRPGPENRSAVKHSHRRCRWLCFS